MKARFVSKLYQLVLVLLLLYFPVDVKAADTDTLTFSQAKNKDDQFVMKIVREATPTETRSSKQVPCDCNKELEEPQCRSPITSDFPLGMNGIFPHLTATASSGPKRSESGTGALMPWADKLYMVSYLSVPGAGSGTGLYEIDENLQVSFTLCLTIHTGI